MGRRTLSGRQSPRCAVVRHDSCVPDTRPHSRTFSEEARKELGQAVQRAREGAGHPYRPSFADFAGPPLGVRSLLKLEKGDPVSAQVYEAAGRALGRLYEDWSVETPLQILGGEPAPKGLRREGIEGGREAAEEEPAEEEMPDPAQYADLEGFLRAVIVQLRKQGMPEKAILRAAAKIVDELEQRPADTERFGPDTEGGRVS